MALSVRSSWVFCLFLFLHVSKANLPHKRFEYKLSFKGPHLIQRDGTVPFWEHTGHAIASDESIRITPSLRSKKGQVWSKMKNSNENWEVEVTFRISGRGRVGADGLALWYTVDKGMEGPVFGSSDKWNGLGVFFDSFDNDGQHNNPYIMAMVNDGTKEYDHFQDGQSQQLGGCLRDFRNKPFPVKVRIEYYQKALTVYFHNGMTNNAEDFELCMRAENVVLPPEGFFGVTAATGGLADDHDVNSWLTHSLTAPTASGSQPQVSEEERKKFESEFDEYWQKLQKAKEDYKKEHPDKKPKESDYDNEQNYENQDQRELRQIFEGQTHIHAALKHLTSKLDEIIGRQERTLSQVALIGQGQGQVAQPPVQGQPPPMIDTIKRHEVDEVLRHQRDLVGTINALKGAVSDIQSRAMALQQQQAAGGAGNEAGGGGDGGQAAAAAVAQSGQEIKANILTLHNDVRSILNRPQGGNVNCPPPPEVSCVSTFYLLILMVVQVLLFIAYSAYRSNKEAQAKKFY